MRPKTNASFRNSTAGPMDLCRESDNTTPFPTKTPPPGLRADRLKLPTETEEVYRSTSLRPSTSTFTTPPKTNIRSTTPEMLVTPTVLSKPNEPQHTRRRQTRSPTSSYSKTIDISTIPPAVARNSRRKSAWLKARAQHARNQALRYEVEDEAVDFPNDSPRDFETMAKQSIFSTDIGPKRKQCAFVMEEEMEFFREDRAGTPHISELQADDDVLAPLSVEELGMVGEAEALEEEEDVDAFLRTFE